MIEFRLSHDKQEIWLTKKPPGFQTYEILATVALPPLQTSRCPNCWERDTLYTPHVKYDLKEMVVALNHALAGGGL